MLAVVHLISTEGTGPAAATWSSGSTWAESLRLARLVADLMPGEPRCSRLLACCCSGARRPARVDPDGDLVLLADQDRSRWDPAAVAEGTALLAEAVRRSGGVAGPYQLQAHLAACHSTAASWADTDWDRIVGLYGLVLRLSANPAVALNRAVAVGHRDGPTAGLAALDAIDRRGRTHLWHAARADALTRLGRTPEARTELEAALAAAPTTPDRRLLTRRLAAL